MVFVNNNSRVGVWQEQAAFYFRYPNIGCWENL